MTRTLRAFQTSRYVRANVQHAPFSSSRRVASQLSVALTMISPSAENKKRSCPPAAASAPDGVSPRGVDDEVQPGDRKKVKTFKTRYGLRDGCGVDLLVSFRLKSFLISLTVFLFPSLNFFEGHWKSLNIPMTILWMMFTTVSTTALCSKH